MNNEVCQSAVTIENRRILVVDDNESIRSLITSLLEADNLNTKTANNGLEALERAELFQPEVIIMDLDMPVMNGYEATRRLRLHPDFRMTPIIGITGGDNKHTAKRCTNIGFDKLLEKPFDMYDLLETVCHYLENIVTKS